MLQHTVWTVTRLSRSRNVVRRTLDFQASEKRLAVRVERFTTWKVVQQIFEAKLVFIEPDACQESTHEFNTPAPSRRFEPRRKSKTPGPWRRSTSDLPRHIVPDVLPRRNLPASSCCDGITYSLYLSRTRPKSGPTFCRFLEIV